MSQFLGYIYSKSPIIVVSNTMSDVDIHIGGYQSDGFPTLESEIDACAILIYNSSLGKYYENKENKVNIDFYFSTISYLKINEESKYFECAPYILISNARTNITFSQHYYTNFYNYGSGVLLRTITTDQFGGNFIENQSYVEINISYRIYKSYFHYSYDKELYGDIIIDKYTECHINLSNITYYGAINAENNSTKVYVKIYENVTWTLTADSYVYLENYDETSSSNIIYNNFKIYEPTGKENGTKKRVYCENIVNKCTNISSILNKKTYSSITADYLNTTSEYLIYFNFTEKLPYRFKIYRQLSTEENLVKIDNCEFYDEKTILCNIKENDFPLNIENSSKKMKYNLYFENECNEFFDAFYEVYVYEHETNLVTFEKVIYPSKCSNFKKGTEIYLYGNSSNIEVFKPSYFDYYLKIKSKMSTRNYDYSYLLCTLIKNDDYSINYQIKMKCTISGNEIINGKLQAPLYLEPTENIYESYSSEGLLYNYVNIINITEETTKYNCYYTNINMEEQKIELTYSDDSINEFEITFKETLYYLPTVYVYNKNTDFNETLNCTKSKYNKITCQFDNSIFNKEENPIVKNYYKVYLINVCGETEYVNTTFMLNNNENYLKFKWILLCALILMF